MYALVKTGGKQYRVAKDDTILVERIAADEGAQVILDDVVTIPKPLSFCSPPETL